MSKRGEATFHEVVTFGAYRLVRRRVQEPATKDLDAVANANNLRARAAEYEREGQHVGPVESGGFKQRSRNAMRWRMASLPWWEACEQDAGRLAMLTLTYPLDWKAVCPDAPALKRQLKAFRMRWDRKWGPQGSPLRGMYVVEFQPREWQEPEYRQAPHIHCYVVMPAGVRLERDETDHNGWKMWPWALHAWGEIVNADDGGKHRRRGVDVTWAEYGAGIGMHIDTVGHYFWRESGKLDQKTMPEGFGLVQWWGVWGMKPVEHEREIGKVAADGSSDNDRYFSNRRVARKLRDKESGRRVQAPRGHDGLTVWGVAGRDVAGKLERWVDRAAPST